MQILMPGWPIKILFKVIILNNKFSLSLNKPSFIGMLQTMADAVKLFTKNFMVSNKMAGHLLITLIRSPAVFISYGSLVFLN